MLTLYQGLAVDPNEDFVFAAGQDTHIRAWSLRTGERVPFPSGSPIMRRHHRPISIMQVVEEGQDLCLSAVGGEELLKYQLGSRAL